jgi:hypothetical protein
MRLMTHPKNGNGKRRGDPRAIAIKRLVKFYYDNVDELETILGTEYHGDAHGIIIHHHTIYEP